MAPSKPMSLNKVPHIVLSFWVIKILATTLGEIGGDAVSMTFGLGYAASAALFIVLFVVAVLVQIRVRRFHPALYWLVILSTTTAGTTLSDFLDRTAHLGYIGGSALLIAILLAVLIMWRLALGKISFAHVVDPKAEAFYWAAILASNTLGTALGDFTADDAGLGFLGGAALFTSALALILAAYLFTKVSRTLLFWLAFVLTRPFGATVGDALTKPHNQGGMALGTLPASLILALSVIGLIVFFNRRSKTNDIGGSDAPLDSVSI
jgi:uncharacterized membrane-anchored protein